MSMTRLKILYYNIRFSISSLIKWIPTIIKIRDWDAKFLYLLIYKHLEHLEKLIRYEGHHVNHIKDADRIKIAKNLAKRLYEDEYFCNELKPVKKIYGEKIDLEFIKREDGYYNLIDKSSPEEKEARSKALNKSTEMMKQDKEMLFSMLKKYIDHWWD